MQFPALTTHSYPEYPNPSMVHTFQENCLKTELCFENTTVTVSNTILVTL